MNIKKYIRKLYYLLRPKMRFFVRRYYFFFYDIIKKGEDMPPMGLIYTGAGDFKRQGIEWRQFFIENGLKAESSFLDIGSGIGRIALGLRSFLHGQYEGFEAMEVGVNWCKKNISSKYSNFNFNWVPLYNDLYNADGIDASKYKFEYNNETFDFSASISVFTHMIDTEVENYLQETSRVLKSEGILVATFFIFDEKMNADQNTNKNFTFQFKNENYYLMDKKVKGANVCFKRKYLNQLFETSGFKIVKEIKGFWSGSPKLHYLGFQDIIVLQKVK